MKTKSLLFLVLITFTCAKQLRFLEQAKNGAQTQSEINNVISTAMTCLNVVNQTGAAKFMGHVGMIIDAAATIIDTFKSSNTRTFQSVVPGTGYKTFAGNFEFDFTVGYRLKGYNVWKDQMIEQFKVAAKDQNDFKASLETGAFSKKEIFSSYSFMKDAGETPEVDKDGNRVISFINIMTYRYRRDLKNKFDAIISQCEARVKLFPNKLIYLREKSVAGGIKSSSTYEEEWQDKDFTPADMDSIVKFFQLATYNELAKNMGIITNIYV